MRAYPGVWINPTEVQHNMCHCDPQGSSFSPSLTEPPGQVMQSWEWNCYSTATVYLWGAGQVMKTKTTQERQRLGILGRSCVLRPLLPSSNDEPVPQSRVHGEHWSRVSLGHQPDQKMILPHVDISIYGTSEREAILQHTAASSDVTDTLAFLFSFK